MKPIVLVYGWYHQQNLGDDLFATAFVTLFPEFEFRFVNHIGISDLQGIAAVFFGGGSFIDQAPQIPIDALALLKTKKIFYLGVGAETNIHPTHMVLLEQAEMIVTRTQNQVEKLRNINPHVLFLPDLVYSLRPTTKSNPVPKSVLVMPNISVVPHWSDPHWKHAAWGYFKSEFAQFLDGLIDSKHKIVFTPLCKNSSLHDNGASYEIINAMRYRGSASLTVLESDIEGINSKLTEFETIITQRFHGIVLSEIAKVPYISIYHHDKLKSPTPGEGEQVSYYGLTKAMLFESFNQLRKMKFSTESHPVPEDTYENFRKTVIHLVVTGING